MKYKKQLSEDLVTGLNIKTKVVGQSILGDDNFVSWAQETFLEKRKDRGDRMLEKFIVIYQRTENKG
jgi:hypothetical protein